MNNKITKLFNIKYPIIQGGMIWCSGAKLAAAVSNAGGLGLIGAGSMFPDVLRDHIRKCKTLTDKPFGVNLPLLMGDAEEKINIILSEGVKIIFTSAGNPKTWTSYLKEKGMIMVHIVPGTKYGIKSEAAGVDAIVAEGFEAGGHNGREETTTMCLIPKITEEVSIPVIAAGGIGSGKAMAAAFALGADAVQIGSLFAACRESSAHDNFKQKIFEAKEGETLLMLKKLAPVRLLSNDFAFEVYKQESTGASKDELNELLGKTRAKRGMFDGDMQEGELEIGQVSSMIDRLKSAGEIVEEIWFEYKKVLKKISL
ncbi:MAG: nitronate monooxygenase [Candidatus Cloacimonetes bacterium]|nr:nitronate monooxygenase [Candidatus Cloacimonadota bacterium]MCF7813387.1 nitronate monooxygenase [Candidatus Cloacimonadota bacterium]MCF7867488.1 nitronate monooxygenase [Candidatus Cloacimonadota bacterium]MCF7883009.1 nitronate monooxygenase [Candidatus Cloacimonadota bacterium]